jgi:hypothetical protein
VNTIIYANSAHERDDLASPLRADRWMWAAGDVWCAVIADWHTDWWDGADPDDIAARPYVWSRPIDEVPTTGTLSYTSAAGNHVTHPAPGRRDRGGAAVAHAFASTAHGECIDIHAEHFPGAPAFQLTLTGVSREESRVLASRLRGAFSASGRCLPYGHTVLTTTTSDHPLDPGIGLALACAVLAADEQLVAERLATHALHGELCPDGSLRATGDFDALALAAYLGGASALIAPAWGAASLPLRSAASLREVIATLERGPLPICCPACGHLPEVLSGEELVDLRNAGPADAPAHEANCEDDAGWRCANVNCTHFSCYFPAALSTE